MDQLTEVKAGTKDNSNYYCDAIINYYTEPKKDETGQITWIDESKYLAKCRNKSNQVRIYVKDENEGIFRINISTDSIKKLSKIITEIESQDIELQLED